MKVYQQGFKNILIGKTLATNILNTIRRNESFNPGEEHFIPSVVIIGDGPVDRTSHYYIYRDSNLFPLIKQTADPEM